jgi:hypothetical protein
MSQEGAKHQEERRRKQGSKLERQQRKTQKLRLGLERTERNVQEAMSGSKRKRENGDEGDDQPLRSPANNGTELSLSKDSTPCFLRRISKADDYDIQTRTFGKYLMEVSLSNS